MSRLKNDFVLIAILLLMAFNFNSCTASRKVVYLYDLKDTTAGNFRTAQSGFENLIQKNDLLWITVGGSNIADLVVINSASGVAAGTGLSSQTTGNTSTGYMVEADGNIKLPFLDKVKAEGLSRLQLEASITEKLMDYTKHPVVNVRFLNYSFSVIGEVIRPGRFNMSTERTTLLEALSMAGDISEMGKRENVLVIREVNGERLMGRINLSSKNLFNSPYYYLKTNDVIYVEPVKTRFITRSGVPQYFSIAAVAISLLITIINLSK
ncbi:MAG: polysaccharide biosynthesis/export family protein [Ferruginibacter sp.]